ALKDSQTKLKTLNEKKQRLSSQTNILSVNQSIDENPRLKQMIEENRPFVKKVQSYGWQQLTAELQTKYLTMSTMNHQQANELAILILEYKSRGFDFGFIANTS